MSIYDIFHLLGGLSLFLYGMHIMGDSLEKRAGKRLRPILEQLTSRPIKGVLLGAGVTAVIQSSSATTVMIVGFVNSGIMQLRQAIPVVMGANIGTTVTAWLLSLTGIQSDAFLLTLLKPTTFSPILAFIGIILLLTSRRNKDTAGILLGFAVLMFGMEQMSMSVAGLAHNQAFRELLILFSNPLFGVLIGALVTGIIQSSSASVGILQAIANTGALTYGAALPIIMGQNIGTCVTSLLSAIGANRNAKRVAAVHLAFNIIGTAIFLALFYAADGIIGFTFTAGPVNALGIAITHTIFNIATTFVLFPFIPQLEALAIRLVRDKKGKDTTTLLDPRLLATPTMALAQSRKLTLQMAQLSYQAFLDADALLDNYNPKQAQKVEQAEATVDLYEDKLGAYLVQFTAHSMTQAESQEVSMLLRCIGDFERISDHALNISEVALELHTKSIAFSDAAIMTCPPILVPVRELVEI